MDDKEISLDIVEEVELNVYYGIHFPLEYEAYIRKALCDKKYAKLFDPDHREITFNARGETIVFGYTKNSDFTPTRGCIYIEDMSNPENDFINKEIYQMKPEDLIAAKANHKHAIAELCILLKIIKTHFAKTKKDTEQLYFGWGVLACTFESSSESDDS